MSRKWFSITEAAEYFSISKKTLYSLTARRRLPEIAVLRLGRQIRIDVAAIEPSEVKRKKMNDFSWKSKLVPPGSVESLAGIPSLWPPAALFKNEDSKYGSG